ncbi:hypothetical protein HZB89_01675 [archaeon]|nr:hypothetical protein [archaeon]
MQGKIVHLRLPEKLYLEIEKTVKDFGFQSAADFLRASARKALDEYETQKAIRVLEKNKGILKGKVKRLTNTERGKLWEQFLKKRAQGGSIFKDLGLI